MWNAIRDNGGGVWGGLSRTAVQNEVFCMWYASVIDRGHSSLPSDGPKRIGLEWFRNLDTSICATGCVRFSREYCAEMQRATQVCAASRRQRLALTSQQPAPVSAHLRSRTGCSAPAPSAAHPTTWTPHPTTRLRFQTRQTVGRPRRALHLGGGSDAAAASRPASTPPGATPPRPSRPLLIAPSARQTPRRAPHLHLRPLPPLARRRRRPLLRHRRRLLLRIGPLVRASTTTRSMAVRCCYPSRVPL